MAGTPLLRSVAEKLDFMDKSFRFRVSTNLRYGIGESEKLGEEITELGYTKVAAIIDQGVFEHPQVKKALESVKQAGLSLEVYKSTAVEPGYDYLESFKKQLVGKNFDCLVAIGGGSTIDLTKGVAVLLTNEGEAISFRGFPKLKCKPLPIVAIPTTAGTGSEVTYHAVFTDTAQKRKFGVNSVLNFPVCAIIDPLMTADCPKSATVSSGTDALVHTLESFVNKDHTLVSRMYSKQAFPLLFHNLGKVLDRPKDPSVRGGLALGAYLAGIALMNGGRGGAVGALSYPLGVYYGVPHGLSGAVFLTHVTGANICKGYSDYAELYDLIEGADTGLPVEEKVARFGKQLAELWKKLEIPAKLSAFNLTREDVEFLIEQYDELSWAISQNPVEITKEDVRNIFYQMI